MNKKSFTCCINCYRQIESENERSAQLWTDLCSLKIKSRALIKIKSQDFDELTILERCGYVTSTDTPDHIVVKVKGHYITECGVDVFCIKGGNHD